MSNIFCSIQLKLLLDDLQLKGAIVEKEVKEGYILVIFNMYSSHYKVMFSPVFSRNLNISTLTASAVITENVAYAID